MKSTVLTPDGLLLSNDDAYRKFGNSFVLTKIKEEVKVVKVHRVGSPNISVIHTESGNSMTLPNDDMELLNYSPKSGFYNLGDKVLQINRTGERQWQFGLVYPAYRAVLYSAIGNIDISEYDFRDAIAIYLPKWCSLPKALQEIREGSRECVSINGLYWLRKKSKKDKLQHVNLLRKEVSVGLFIEGERDRFYRQAGTEIFDRSVQKLLESE